MAPCCRIISPARLARQGVRRCWACTACSPAARLEHCAVGALGIMPYISATIIIQLLTAVIPTLEQAGPRRRWAHQDHSIWPLSDRASLPGTGRGDGDWLGEPGKAFPGLEHGGAVGALLGCAHLVLPPPNAADADDGHDAADVAGRTDHRARHRQRRFAGHHHRHSGAPARSGGGAQGHVLPGRRDRGQIQLRACDRAGAPAGRCDCRRHCHHPGAAEGPGPIRAAGGGPQSLFGRHLVHAVAGQLRGRHADHFCPGDPDVPAEDLSDAGPELRREVLRGDCACAGRGAILYMVVVRVDDSVLLVFLGGDPVQ